MTKYGSASIKVEFDLATADTLQDMTAYCTELNGFSIKGQIDETTCFGDTYVKRAYSGFKEVDTITIGGYYDDTATTGPEAVFNDVGCAATVHSSGLRTLKITWGSTKTSSVPCIIESYSRRPDLKGLTRFEVTLQPAGVVTEV